MCFGNNTQNTQNTGSQFGVQNTNQNQANNINQSATVGGPQWLTDAANQNVAYASSIQNTGFLPYQGPFVANFSPQQQQSFDTATNFAGGITPWTGQIGSLLSGYANAGPQSVSANTIASQMSPYMNQYVEKALAPQLNLQDQQFATQNKGFDAQASGAGAFGDTGWGLGRTNLTQQQDTARTGLVGNAYNAAFNTAIGAGAQDVSNDLQAKLANANFAETALGRQLTGANALYGAGQGAMSTLNSFGGQQTAQQQAYINALYNQYLQAQQYPFLASQNVNAALGAGRGASPTTSTGATTSTGSLTGSTGTAGNTFGTTASPDNSGFGLLGSVAGAVGTALGSGGLASLLALSDPKLKENIKEVGKLYDGTPVHKFNFKGDPRTQIGLMAPDVKKRTPEAVNDNGPFAMVDYDKATAPSAGLAGQLLGFAFGGQPPVGVPSVVGEQGPELFVPQQPGTIVPNPATSGIGPQSGVTSPGGIGPQMSGPTGPAPTPPMMPNGSGGTMQTFAPAGIGSTAGGPAARPAPPMPSMPGPMPSMPGPGGIGPQMSGPTGPAPSPIPPMPSMPGPGGGAPNPAPYIARDPGPTGIMQPPMMPSMPGPARGMQPLPPSMSGPTSAPQPNGLIPTVAGGYDPTSLMVSGMPSATPSAAIARQFGLAA